MLEGCILLFKWIPFPFCFSTGFLCPSHNILDTWYAFVFSLHQEILKKVSPTACKYFILLAIPFNFSLTNFSFSRSFPFLNYYTTVPFVVVIVGFWLCWISVFVFTAAEKLLDGAMVSWVARARLRAVTSCFAFCVSWLAALQGV